MSRVGEVEKKFPKDCDLQSRGCFDVDFDLDAILNSDSMLRELKKLQYKQLKVPNTPFFLAEECLSGGGDISNPEPVIVLSWQSGQQMDIRKSTAVVTANTPATKTNSGYILEIDDGTPDSGFKQVYCGPDSMCQINGLVPNSIYNARVKAFNQAGFSDYSHVISVSSTPSMLFEEFSAI